jgi:hypothetical protein
MPNTTESPLICAAGKGSGRYLNPTALNHIYSNYKKKVFPKILLNNDLPGEDKSVLQNLLEKPWNPYIRSALNTWNTLLAKELVHLLS